MFVAALTLGAIACDGPVAEVRPTWSWGEASHASSFHDLAFSPSGDWVAAMSRDGWVRVRHLVEPGRLVDLKLESRGGSVEFLDEAHLVVSSRRVPAFVIDLARPLEPTPLVAGQTEGGPVAWNAPTNELLSATRGGYEIFSVSCDGTCEWRSTGRVEAGCSIRDVELNDRWILYLCAERGSEPRVFKVPRSGGAPELVPVGGGSMRLLEDGVFLARGPRVVRVDLRSGEEAERFVSPDGVAVVNGLAIDAAAGGVVVATDLSSDQYGGLFAVGAEEVERLPSSAAKLRAAEVSPDGRRVAFSAEDGSLTVIERLSDGGRRSQPIFERGWEIESVFQRANLGLVTVSFSSGEVVTLNTASGETERILRPEGGVVAGAALVAPGSLWAIRHAETSQAERSVVRYGYPEPGPGEVVGSCPRWGTCMTVFEHAPFVATVDTTAGLRLHDAGSGQVIAELPTSRLTERIYGAADGRSLAVVNRDAWWTTWRLPGPVADAPCAIGEANQTWPIGASPDLRWVAVNDGAVAFVSVATGETVARLQFDGVPAQVQFSADGEWLLITARELETGSMFVNRHDFSVRLPVDAQRGVFLPEVEHRPDGVSVHSALVAHRDGRVSRLALEARRPWWRRAVADGVPD